MKKKSITIIGLTFILGLMGCQSKDTPVTTTGGGTTVTTGTVTGTATYTSPIFSAISSSKKLAVRLVPNGTEFNTATANGTTIQETLLSSSGATFTFTNVPAGDYVMAAIVDLDGNQQLSNGEPFLIYSASDVQGGNLAGTTASKFTVTAGATLSATIVMGDAYTDAEGATQLVKGTIAYTGSAGTIGGTNKVYINVYSTSVTTTPYAVSAPNPNGTSYQGWAYASTGVKFSFAVPAGTYNLAVAFDTNGNAAIDSGEPIFIYTPGSSAGTGIFGNAAANFTIGSGQGSAGDVNLGAFSFGDTYAK